MNNYLLLTIYDDRGREISDFSLPENICNEHDIRELKIFLAYYNQTFKLKLGNSLHNGHTCLSIKCTRSHIIDINIYKNVI